MLKNLLLFSSIFLIVFSSLAQTQKTCGFDEIHKELLNANPEYKAKIESSELKFQEFIKNAPKRNGVYKIPLVVHVMETGSSISSISDQQIQNAIKELNEKYRKIPNSIGDGNGVDVTIEFALAVRDPYGKCTNGINRYDMSGVTSYVSNGVKRTSLGITDTELKSYISWNQNKYYNIWLVTEIENNEGGGGTQGYAYFSDSHGAAWDGAVILINAFKDPNNNTCSHELGHAFNLYHSFEGDQDASGNAICPPNSNCSTQGDRVCDTPPHKRTNGNCVSGTNSCDNNSSNDKFMHNYMDYSSDECANEFTLGQKERMLAALTVNRGSFLESNGNLTLTPVSEPTLDFTSTSEYICTGNSVTLYDQSTCIPNTYINGAPWSAISYNWLVKSGVTELTSTSQTPTFNLTTPGIYDVTMNITTILGTYSFTKKGAIIVGTATKTAVCIPNSSNVGNYWYTVNNVIFNTINKSTNSYLNEGYKNFACEKSTIVAPGKSYPFSVSLRAAQNYSEFVEAFIDYNNNGVFETGELIYSGSTSSNTLKTLSASITIPTNAVQDQPLRMRIIGEAGTSSISAAKKNCTSTFFIGDVEDYTVYISSKAATVSIAASPSTTITYGTSVTFTATTTNEGTNPVYQWYINDNKIAENSSSTFTSSTLLANDVVKCILISNLSGVTISPAVSNTITMNVTGVPLSNFKSSAIIPCTGESVTFTDLSLLSPTSWAWTFEGGNPATSNTKNPVVTYATPGVYRVTLTASNSLGTGTTSTKTNYIIVSSTPNNSCSSITRANDGSQYGIGISRVDFNDISNVTSYSDAAFQDFSCSKKTILTANTTYPITVKTGPNTQWLRVYIDYNGDGDFLDAGELVFSPGDATGQFTGSFTTQTNPSVKDKILRMRIITDYPSNVSPSSCRGLSYGQAEDFGIVFRSIVCDNPVVPSFTAVNSICAGGIIESLPTTSLNGINGTWSPAINNTATTTYTFTPTIGQCASTTTMTITVTPKSTPTFTAVSPICSGEDLAALPTLSNNSISGSWSPALNNLQTTTYTFTPNSNQCGNTTTMIITVNSIPDAGIISGFDSLCVGTAEVFVSSVSGGTWSVDDNAIATVDQQGEVVGLTSGEVTLSYTVSSGGSCNAVASKTIQIINGLDMSSSSTVCIGSTTTLVPTITGGTWSIVSGATNVTLSNGVVTGRIAGSATIGYSITTNIFGCPNSINKTITVSARPSAGTLTGSNYVCKNSSVKLTPSVAGGTWTSLKPSIASVDAQGNVKGLMRTSSFTSGVVSYTVTNASGCSASVGRGLGIDSLPVVPIIAGPNKICSNGTAFFRTTNTAGVLWTAGPSLTASSAFQGVFTHRVASNGAVPSDNYNTFVKATSYSVNKVCTSEATKTVQLRTVATKNITMTAASNLVVNATTPVSVTFPNGLTTTNTSGRYWISSATADLSVVSTTNLSTTVKALRVPTVTPKLYFNAIETSTGCGITAYKQFTVSAASLLDVSTSQTTSLEHIQLYPNPSNGRFNIVNADGATSVKLVDITGRVIATHPIISGTSTVDFSGVAVGKYMLHISGDNFNEVQPIVIE